MKEGMTEFEQVIWSTVYWHTYSAHRSRGREYAISTADFEVLQLREFARKQGETKPI